MREIAGNFRQIIDSPRQRIFFRRAARRAHHRHRRADRRGGRGRFGEKKRRDARCHRARKIQRERAPVFAFLGSPAEKWRDAFRQSFAEPHRRRRHGDGSGRAARRSRRGCVGRAVHHVAVPTARRRGSRAAHDGVTFERQNRAPRREIDRPRLAAPRSDRPRYCCAERPRKQHRIVICLHVERCASAGARNPLGIFRCRARRKRSVVGHSIDEAERKTERSKANEWREQMRVAMRRKEGRCVSRLFLDFDAV